MARTVQTKRSTSAAPKQTKSQIQKTKASRSATVAKSVTKVVAKAKTTKPKVIKAKAKAAVPAKKAPKPTDPEKERIREEKQRQKEERMKIREEKARQRAEKEEIKRQKALIWELNPNTKIKSATQNALLQKQSGKRVFENQGCCIFCNNREAIQAARYGDQASLKTALYDMKNISNPLQNFAIDCPVNIVNTVVKQKDFESFKMVIEFIQKMEKQEAPRRVKLPKVALSKQGTGFQNAFSHNFPMRQVKLSRGGKEGNNAFTYDSKLRTLKEIDATDFLKLSPPLSFVKQMLHGKTSENKASKGPVWKQNRNSACFLDRHTLMNFWQKAVRKGDYNLVRYIFQQNEKQKMLYLTKQFTNAILQGEEAEKIRILNRNSLSKGSDEEYSILPAHIACINPDPTALHVFFRMYPTSLQTDQKGRDLIHYAVMNQESSILQFLLSKKQIVNNADSEGVTPLMLACKYARETSVALILEDQETQKEKLDKEDKDFVFYNNFYSYCDSVGPYKNTPLHYAVRGGSLKIVKRLVESGANFDAKNFYNDTPLSVACQRGEYQIAEYLISKGSNIHGVDKQQRSPLIRACQNGQAHIVSLLLRKGVNPNFSDLSENTALHHACAYGWLNVVKVLLQAGSDINLVNEWKSSATLIAMLKGHFGIVDYLLSQPKVDASLVDDQGRSLVSQLCLNLNEDSYKNLKFLLLKKKIDANLCTANGESPLHFLASNNIAEIAKKTVQEKEEVEQKARYFMRKGKKIRIGGSNNRKWGYDRNSHMFKDFMVDEKERKEYESFKKKLQENQVRCAQLLIQNGCDPAGVTSDEFSKSPIFFAVQSNSYELANTLLASSSQIDGKDVNGRNILHQIAVDSMHFPNDSFSFLTALVSKCKSNTLQKLVKMEESSGLTPYHIYFNNLDVFFQDNWNSGYRCFSAEYLQFMQDTFFPNALDMIEKVSKFYSNKLGYDISSRVGLAQFKKNEAKDLLDNEGISQKNYDDLLSLKLAEKAILSQGKKNQDSDNNSDDDSDEEEKSKDISDLIHESGYTNDRQKKFLGLQKISGIVEKENPASGNSIFARHRRQIRKRNIRRANRNRRKFRSRNAYDSDDDGYESEENNSGDNFDAYEFYEHCHTLKTVLHLVVSSYKRMFKSNANKDLYEKVKGKFYDLVSKLLQISPDLPKSTKEIDRVGFNKCSLKGKSPIFRAFEGNMIDLAIIMANSHKLDLTAKQPQTGITALHMLARITDADQINELIKNTSKFELDKNGNSPLHYAAFKRNLPLVKALIQSGKKVNINQLNKFGVSPLHLSLLAFNESMDHTPALERFLLNSGADPRSADSEGRTPLFYLFKKDATSQAKSQDPANVLMTMLNDKSFKTKDLAVQDKMGNTVLHFACEIGATICALSLINHKANPMAVNMIGNSPYSLALAAGQQQICTFMIQNEWSVDEKVSVLEPNEAESTREELKSLILPRALLDQWTKEDKLEKAKGYVDILSSKFKLKSFTPFYKAMEQGWGGVGFLLFSKDFDPFQALTGCLQARKYSKFLDLLGSVDRKVVHQVDRKGRNLLHILFRYLGELELSNENAEELKSAFSIVNVLTSSQSEKKDNNLIFDQKGFNLDIVYSTDSRGYNLLHSVAHGHIRTFEYVLKKFTKSQQIKLLAQKSTQKYKCSPLILLALRMVENQESQFVQLIHTIVDMIGLKAFQEIQWDFVKMAPKESPIPLYLDYNKNYLYDEPTCDTKSHLVNLLFTDTENFNLDELSNEQLILFLKMMSPFIKYKDSVTQETLLMRLVKKNTNFQFLQYLLGSKYDAESQEFEIEDESKPRVNINLVDSKGRTALHYAIQPSERLAGKGFRQNGEVIQLLMARGAKIDIKDKQGKSALDLAKNNKNILNLLKPCKKAAAKFQKPDLEDPFKAFLESKYAPEAELFLKKQLQKLKESKMQIDEGSKTKPEVEVDYDHEDMKGFEVLQSDVLAKDGVKKLYYDCILIKIDVKASYYGVNSFYVMQLLFDKVKNLWVLWTRWGRIGEFGQHQRTPFPNLLAAQMEFDKLFKQKSGNKWSDVATFTNLPKKYKLRRLSGQVVYFSPETKQWSNSETEIEMNRILVNFKDHQNLHKSKLTEAQLDFITPLVDSASLLRKFKQQQFSENFIWESLLDGQTLKSLHGYLKRLLELSKLAEKQQKDLNLESYKETREQMFDLINEYYELSTPTNFAFDKMKSLDNEHQITQEMKKVLRLRQIESATQLLLAAGHNLPKMNPYDFVYKNLATDVQVLPPSNPDYEYIMRYVNASASSENSQKFVLDNIYSVDQGSLSGKQSSTTNFDDIHQHMMLFHGTNQANLLSILDQGMKIKPQNAAFFNGSVFGEGIYMSDKFSVASRYSGISTNETFYVLVCEVAMGNVMNSLMGQRYGTNEAGYFTDGRDFAKGYHSVRVMGRTGPDFSQNWVQASSNVIWPIGDQITYDDPYYIAENKESYTDLTELNKDMKPKKKAKKTKAKKGKSKAKKVKKIRTGDSDESMDSDSDSSAQSDSESENEDVEFEQMQQFVKVKDQNSEIYHFKPSECHHISHLQEFIDCYNTTLQYYLADSQYVIGNSDQVRVKYIVQVSKVKNSK